MNRIRSEVFEEPPCWGSGEISLFPQPLQRMLRTTSISLVNNRRTKKRTNKSPEPIVLPLSILAQSNWATFLKGPALDLQGFSVLDAGVAELDRLFEKNPDAFDVPVLTKPIDQVGAIMQLPFEVGTWELLASGGIAQPGEVLALVTATFREIRERLGNMRAALDFSVTADSWLTQSAGRSWSFQLPETAEDLEVLAKLARIRAFRCCGLNPALSSYSARMADVLPRNWSIAQARRWTLDQCAEELGLTRERVRQILTLRLMAPAQRRWPRSQALLGLADDYGSRREERGDPSMNSTQPLLRSDAAALLFAYGFSQEFLRSAESLSSELKTLGYRLHDVRRSAYVASERIGFVGEELLKERLCEEFPLMKASLFDDVMSQLILIRDLPHGYAYVEGADQSWFVNDITRLIGAYGPLPFEEIYAAASRFYKLRVVGLVFPPRAVIREFFERDKRFWLENEIVGLVDPTTHHLAEIQLWVADRIRESVGGVIHRSALWDLARRDGISPGTLTVYFGYSMYFKPIGRGCLTLTGSFPTEETVSIAVAKGLAIRVRQRILSWKVEQAVVYVDLELGSETVDNGLFNPPAELRRLLQPSVFRVMINGVQRGNAAWSGNVLYGLSSGLSAYGCAPGDHVRLVFDVSSKELYLRELMERSSLEGSE